MGGEARGRQYLLDFEALLVVTSGFASFGCGSLCWRGVGHIYVGHCLRGGGVVLGCLESLVVVGIRRYWVEAMGLLMVFVSEKWRGGGLVFYTVIGEQSGARLAQRCMQLCFGWEC